MVNEDDMVVSIRERGKLLPTDIYRVSALWLKDEKGRILLAQRKLTKTYDPGKWGPAAAGTVAEGETYESNITKEAREEIGLTGVNFELGPKYLVDTGGKKFFCQWFEAVIPENYPLIRQDSEVEQLRWMTENELRREFLANPNQFTRKWPYLEEIV